MHFKKKSGPVPKQTCSQSAVRGVTVYSWYEINLINTLHIERKQRTLFCIRLNARMRYFNSKTRRIRILALRRMQKSLHCLFSMGNIQNGATLTRRDREETICWKKVIIWFSLRKKNILLLHKIQIKLPMADGLPWRWFSCFSEPQQCYLLGSRWDSHKPPGFYLKYLKMCSEDERSFYGVGTTCG